MLSVESRGREVVWRGGGAAAGGGGHGGGRLAELGVALLERRRSLARWNRGHFNLGWKCIVTYTLWSDCVPEVHLG